MSSKMIVLVVACGFSAAITFSASGSAGSGQGANDAFVYVSAEEGGFCQSQDPCWRRTVVASTGQIRLERFNRTEQSMLNQANLKRVLDIVEGHEFRRALAAGSAKPVCPATIDFGVTLVLETASGRMRDVHAAGCIVTDDRHPYTKLKVLLDRLTAAHFPHSPR